MTKGDFAFRDLRFPSSEGGACGLHLRGLAACDWFAFARSLDAPNSWRTRAASRNRGTHTMNCHAPNPWRAQKGGVEGSQAVRKKRVFAYAWHLVETRLFAYAQPAAASCGLHYRKKWCAKDKQIRAEEGAWQMSKLAGALASAFQAWAPSPSFEMLSIVQLGLTQGRDSSIKHSPGLAPFAFAPRCMHGLCGLGAKPARCK